MRLPAGWRLEELKGLAESMSDGPFGSNLKSSHYTGRGPRVIRLANIGQGSFLEEDDAHISEEHFRKLERYSVREGDLVVASLGSDLPRACVIPSHVLPAIVKADCIRVRLRPDVDPRFVCYALLRPDLKHLVQQSIHGVGRPRLGMTGIKTLGVPVPPLPEQRRIVEAIEEQFSRLDAAGESLGSATRHSALFVTSLRDGMAQAPGEIWRLADLGELVTGNTPSTKVPECWGPGLPFVTPGDFAHGGRLEVAKREVTEQGVARARPVPAQSVLLTCIGATIGKTGFAQVPCVTNQQITTLVPDAGKVAPAFLFQVICSASFQKQVLAGASSTTLPILNKRRLSELTVRLPPLPEQQSLVGELERALSVAAAMNRVLSAARGRVEPLRRSVLREAFAGRLVPQDASDEPALNLLEKVRM